MLIDVSEQVEACRDREDDKYLSLAVSAHASCLVSGDLDLLVLHPFRDIPIINAADFLSMYAAPDAG
jgi:predicted nucleic acid-binding protein